MSFTVEPMADADLGAVVAIEQEVAVAPWTRGHFADSLRAGYSGWVGRQEGELVGFALWMLAYTDAHLLNIGVRASSQGSGCGSQLLRQVIAAARDAGALSLLLEVRPSNTNALRLYQHVGFTEVGRRKGYYPPPPHQSAREDALVLCLRLDEETRCDVKN